MSTGVLELFNTYIYPVRWTLSHCIEAKLQFEVPFGIAIAGAEKSKVLRHFQHFPASAGASTRPFRVADSVDLPWTPKEFRGWEQLYATKRQHGDASMPPKGSMGTHRWHQKAAREDHASTKGIIGERWCHTKAAWESNSYTKMPETAPRC